MKRLILGAIIALALAAGVSGPAAAAWDHGGGDSYNFACCYF